MCWTCCRGRVRRPCSSSAVPVNSDSKAELERAHAVQKGYKLISLSRWRRDGRAPDHPTQAEMPVGIDYDDTRGAWITMNRAMTENPPGVRPGIDQAELLRLFATIGVGPGQRLEDQSSATLRGLQRAATDGIALLKKMSVGRGKTVNNWNYPPPAVGRAGQANDFITRGAVQALAGIADHDPIEAVYINTTRDANGQPLAATGRYTMTFDTAGGGFPPFDSTYHGSGRSRCTIRPTTIWVKGSTHYSVNSYDPKYQARKQDGSMTVLIQRDRPTTIEKGVYWLQAPPPSDSGTTSAFYLILRVYVPGPEVSVPRPGSSRRSSPMGEGTSSTACSPIIWLWRGKEQTTSASPASHEKSEGGAGGPCSSRDLAVLPQTARGGPSALGEGR